VAAEATAEPTEARAIFRRLVAFKGLQGGFLPPGGEGARGVRRRGYFTSLICLSGDVTRGPPVCVAASGPQQVSANSAGSAVDPMEASFFRSFVAVNGLRPPEAARETRAMCAGHDRRPGGESPLCNLMEVKH